jgi:Ni2+-binding GTPase involved in maturation of urease and hydrogenase
LIRRNNHSPIRSRDPSPIASPRINAYTVSFDTFDPVAIRVTSGPQIPESKTRMDSSIVIRNLMQLAEALAQDMAQMESQIAQLRQEVQRLRK